MAPSVGSVLLLPFSWMYGAGVGVRNLCYDHHLFRSGSLEVPVISIGNISAGGTGKTPMVEYVINYYHRRRSRVAVLSRGYGRSTTGFRIVSDGHSVPGTPAESGDEPYQIAMNHPETVVVVDEDRLRGGREIVARFHPDAIILDDGFQHRRLLRGCDIVLVDAGELLRGELLLPAGRMREPLNALKRASCVVLTNSSDHASEGARRIADVTGTEVVRAELTPVEFVHCATGSRAALGAMTPNRCVAFCGIARPDNFRRTLEALGFSVGAFHRYPDHYRYTDADLGSVAGSYREAGARWILTTEKDAMRLRGRPMPASFPVDAWYFLKMEMTIVEGTERLFGLLDRQVRRAA